MSLILTMCAFSLAMSISPGPVNMVIVSSGANHGFQRTMPFVSGATIGFTLLLLFIGLGFFQFVKSYPFFLDYLTVAGSTFIIYMGYKVATSIPDIAVKDKDIPRFFEGFLLQWLNPKAWIACVSGVSLFSNPETHATLLTFVFLYFLICYASLAAWAILGDKATLLLGDHGRLRLFNIVMGVLLIGCACYMLYIQLI
ncbi:MAG: LysE family translocator [Exilibacterium sp.]